MSNMTPELYGPLPGRTEGASPGGSDLGNAGDGSGYQRNAAVDTNQEMVVLDDGHSSQSAAGISEGGHRTTARLGNNAVIMPASQSNFSFGSSSDGHLKWVLLVFIVLGFTCGNWANNEQLIWRRSESNNTFERRADWAGFPSSYTFSLYFILLLGLLALFSRLSATALLLAVVSLVSVLQDWIMFGIYWPSLNSGIVLDGPPLDKSSKLLVFTKMAVLTTHLVKIGFVVLGAWLFYRRGGVIRLPNMRKSYNTLRGQSALY